MKISVTYVRKRLDMSKIKVDQFNAVLDLNTGIVCFAHGNDDGDFFDTHVKFKNENYAVTDKKVVRIDRLINSIDRIEADYAY